MHTTSFREATVSRRIRCCDESGFTLAEYVAAIAIFLIVVVGAMSVIMYVSTSNAAAARREAALNLASRQIEVARNQPYDNLGTSWPGSPNPKVEGDYTVETLVSWARDKNNRATSRLIHVVVTWGTPRPGKVELQTQIFGLSNVPNTGDVVVRVVEGLSDGTTKPLQGAYVELTPSLGGVQKVLTDSAGEAFMGHVAAGVFNFQATKAGYAIDHSGYGTSPTLVAGTAPAPYIVTAYKESTHRFEFEMEDGSAVPSGVQVTLTGGKITKTGATATPVTQGISSNQVNFGALLPDNYSVQFQLPAGYSVKDTAPTNVAIAAPDSHGSEKITLVRDLMFVVTVINDAGAPVSNAKVQLAGPVSHEAFTDTQGVATIAVSEPGEYGITVSKDKHLEASTTMTLVKGTDADVSLQIRRYGMLKCTYSGTTNVPLYVYDRDGALLVTGTTAGGSRGIPRTVSFDLPPDDYYFVSTKSQNPRPISAVQTGVVYPGLTTDVAVSPSN